jgi:sulfhydrogenase subunit beta (sulfur reductase)
MRIGSAVTIDAEGLDALIATLAARGYETKGPVVRDGAILPGPVGGITDLPVGVRDAQSPGRYRLEQGEGDAVFSWAVGPGSWKVEFFPPAQELWQSTREGDVVTPEAPVVEVAPLAIVGARPCELAALAVLDRVLLDGAFTDPHYAARRADAFVVAAECGSPASTCFCTSMGTGPATESDFDLALTELDDDGHRFVVRVGTARGAEILERVPGSETTPTDMAAREAVLASAAEAIDRRLETEGLAELLARNLDHPRWDDVAERCLSCGNCTLVCPTCFCSDVSDTTDLAGEVRRQRTWASCFDLDHSYIHGGPVRSSISSRYRQWLTHKLSTWWDQFDSSGCVGCGRCIAWCPVGIDLTVEAAAIRASDGALRSSPTSGRDAR